MSAPAARRFSWRGFGAWTMLCGIGFLLDGPAGLAPAFFVALVVLAGLDRRVLGFVGVSFVGLAGLQIVLNSSGGAGEVHLDFVQRSFLPHHLTFIGFTLVLVQVLLERPVESDPRGLGRPAGSGEAAEPDEADGDDRFGTRSADDARMAIDPSDAEPLGNRPVALRIGLVIGFGLIAALMIVGAS